MIRHSNSLFISLVVHIAILIALLFLYINIVEKNRVLKEEHKICLKLCNIAEKKVVEPVLKKEIVQKKPPPKKKIEPLLKPKKPKPKIEKKEVKKKVEAKKKILIVKEEVIAKEVEVLKKKEPLHVEVAKVKEIVEIIEPQESIESKNVRLEKEYIDENIIKIRELIKDNLYYPRSARKRGVTGEVVVKFTISVDSEVHSIEVISSKSDILSRAAKKTIENLSSEFPKPDEELILHVPISYKLD